MNAEIIAVGSELLLGQIINTNARFLSRQLAMLGINVFYHTAVGDNPNRLKSAIEIAEKRANLLIFTGGLGPTKDDLTKETIAKHLNCQLKMDEPAMETIELFFKRTNRKMTENNKKQALVLEGSQVLPNENGMAPGMLLEKDERIYMLLPGPPHEMEPMFLTYGLKAIRTKLQGDEVIVSRVLRFFGIGEAQLETEIEDLIDKQTNPTIAPLASNGEVTLRLTAKHKDNSVAIELIDKIEKEILSRVNDYFYGYDNTSLMDELTSLLKATSLTISCAESLTGGMFQERLTAIPGASSVLKGGVVCYTNEIKKNVLHVKQQTIEGKGVISPECAEELARNVSELMNTDIGISFTGVAGPDEAEGQPVGTVYIGIFTKGKPVQVEKIRLGGSRDSIRERSVKYGCYFLLKRLKEDQSAK